MRNEQGRDGALRRPRRRAQRQATEPDVAKANILRKSPRVL
jgi:hypothetical protein